MTNMLNRSRPREAIVSVVYEVQKMGDDEIPAHFIHEIKTKAMTSSTSMYSTWHNRDSTSKNGIIGSLYHYSRIPRENSLSFLAHYIIWAKSFLSFKSVSSLSIFLHVKVLSFFHALSVLLIFALNVSGKHDTLPARLVPFFELALPF